MKDVEILELLLREMVDYPAAVEVTRTTDQMGVLMTVKAHKDDMGKIIGRSGGNAKALRDVMRVIGAKNDARIHIKIEEPEGRERRYGGERSHDYRHDTDFLKE